MADEPGADESKAESLKKNFGKKDVRMTVGSNVRDMITELATQRSKSTSEFLEELIQRYGGEEGEMDMAGTIDNTEKLGRQVAEGPKDPFAAIAQEMISQIRMQNAMEMLEAMRSKRTGVAAAPVTDTKTMMAEMRMDMMYKQQQAQDNMNQMMQMMLMKGMIDGGGKGGNDAQMQQMFATMQQNQKDANDKYEKMLELMRKEREDERKERAEEEYRAQTAAQIEEARMEAEEAKAALEQNAQAQAQGTQAQIDDLRNTSRAFYSELIGEVKKLSGQQNVTGYENIAAELQKVLKISEAYDSVVLERAAKLGMRPNSAQDIIAGAQADVDWGTAIGNALDKALPFMKEANQLISNFKSGIPAGAGRPTPPPPPRTGQVPYVGLNALPEAEREALFAQMPPHTVARLRTLKGNENVMLCGIHGEIMPCIGCRTKAPPFVPKPQAQPAAGEPVAEGEPQGEPAPVHPAFTPVKVTPISAEQAAQERARIQAASQAIEQMNQAPAQSVEVPIAEEPPAPAEPVQPATEPADEVPVDHESVEPTDAEHDEYQGAGAEPTEAPQQLEHFEDKPPKEKPAKAAPARPKPADAKPRRKGTPPPPKKTKK